MQDCNPSTWKSEAREQPRQLTEGDTGRREDGVGRVESKGDRKEIIKKKGE